MDRNRFDTLTRALATPESRRNLLGALAALPVVGGLAGILSPEDVDAKDRRRRRKGRHKRRKAKGKHKRTTKQGCKPHAKGKVCAGTCGTVKSRQTCGKTVDCGPCDCLQPCGACLTCQAGLNAVAECVPDPTQDGEACDDGVLCTTGGTCSSGVCGGGNPVVCPANECQIPGTCNPATGSCSPADLAPVGTRCGLQPCGTCDNTGDCVSCSGSTPVCTGTGNCEACSATTPCSSGCCDEATGACVMDCPVCQTCEGGVCVADPGQNREVCAGGGADTSICCNGACCDGCCDGAGACGVCLAFVTGPPKYDGNLGGLAGADALCQARADANGLPGTYTAWLSTGNGPNESPASGRFRHSGQPYARLDGVTIAGDWEGLISGTLDAPLNVSETGFSYGVGSTYVWTYTKIDGTDGGEYGGDCEDWTGSLFANGSYGNSARTGRSWTDDSTLSCPSAIGQLYCFQQS